MEKSQMQKVLPKDYSAEKQGRHLTFDT